MDDRELLRAYVDGSESAFAQLVRRYVDYVFSAAFRVLKDASLAEEATQTVFLLLSRRAEALAGHATLAGWLYRTAHYTASRTLRVEQRRRNREQEAAQMIESDSSEELWRELAPQLHAALNELSESDRLSVLLRFFLHHSMREVGLGLGVTEAAAKMRVNRALERLRGRLQARGIVCSSALLAGALTAHSVKAAPVALAGKISLSVPAAAASGWGGARLVKTLILMSELKTKTIVVAAIFAAVLGGIYVSEHLNQPTAPSASGDLGTRTGAGSNLDVNSRQSRIVSKALVGATSLTAPVDPAQARRRLRIALARPLSKSGSVWVPEIATALEQFGTNRVLAFEALKEAVRDPHSLTHGQSLGVTDPDEMIQDRAIWAMTRLAKDVPGIRDYLRNLAWSGKAPLRNDAFTSLNKTGFRAEDVPALAKLLADNPSDNALLSFVPPALGETISSDLQGSAPFIQNVEALLDNGDPRILLSAASALARIPGESDPRISKYIAQGLNPTNDIANYIAISAIGAGGEETRSLVPALMKFARLTDDRILRQAAWRAVSQAQPDLQNQVPEVAQAVKAQSQSQMLSSRLDDGFATFDNLVSALDNPSLAVKAAEKLGEWWGPAAHTSEHDAIPALVQSLAGKNEDDRAKIVEAIHQIDPQFTVARVPAAAVFTAVVEANVTFESKLAHKLGVKSEVVGNWIAGTPSATEEFNQRLSQPEAEKQKTLGKILLQNRAFSTWFTENEAVALAKDLSSRDPAVGKAFVRRLLEKDPALENRLNSSASK